MNRMKKGLLGLAMILTMALGAGFATGNAADCCEKNQACCSKQQACCRR
ncbi:MAG: hypothetical protein ACK5AZ_00045 [Bryobacteraceae bacterium]